MEGKGLTPAEWGFLLLTSDLGEPARKPLTGPQLRGLIRSLGCLPDGRPLRELEEGDLTALGCSAGFARHILDLLDEEDLLDWYLEKARRADCVPITRASEAYPLILRRRLGEDSPGVLWAKGDISLLEAPAVALVGSRELREENRAFAEEAGRQAALQGLTLVSGNARGADRAAQNACLEAGGQVISVVADALKDHTKKENILFLSENRFEGEFTARRALSRNRVIQALGRITFVAQTDLGRGGTWDGTVKNLARGWSPVVCFRDGSEAAGALEQRGAYLADPEELKDFCALQKRERTLFDL